MTAPTGSGAFVSWLETAFAGESSVADAERHLSPDVLATHGAAKVLEVMGAMAAGRDVDSVGQGPIAGIVLVAFADSSGSADAVYCFVDDAGRLFGVAPAPSGVDVSVVAAGSLSSEDRTAIHDLFELTYDEANHGYLDRSLDKLRTVAMARAGDQLVGFSLGDQRVLDLPTVGATKALLAGLACVHPDHRRHGLFRHLSNLSVRAAGNPSAAERSLGAGRMAHPASMRGLAASPSVVPRPGRRPSALQRSIGIAVADAYGVSSFDPETFVCVGPGRPIGFPRMIPEVEPHEWTVFEPVDRQRGDALLALAWNGEAPADW